MIIAPRATVPRWYLKIFQDNQTFDLEIKNNSYVINVAHLAVLEADLDTALRGTLFLSMVQNQVAKLPHITICAAPWIKFHIQIIPKILYKWKICT